MEKSESSVIGNAAVLRLEDEGAQALFAEVLGRRALLRVRVTGWSMEPAVRPGDVVTIGPAAPADLRRGDLILCRLPGGKMVLHRLVSLDRRGGGPVFLTIRGDAMPAADDPIASEAALGRVTELERASPSGRAIRRHPSFPPVRLAGYALAMLRHAFRRWRASRL